MTTSVSPFQVRTLSGRRYSAQRLAAMSGVRLMFIVGGTCVALGLSVFWKGDVSETAAGFWPPAGAALVALLVVPVRRWGWVFAGILFPSIIGLAFGLAPIPSALWWAAGNCAEPALAAIVLRKYASRRPTGRRMLLAFIGMAIIAAPIVGAAIGTVGTVVGYPDPWFEVWSEWALGDGLGVLVVAPVLVAFRSEGHVTGPHYAIKRPRYEVGALIAVVAVSIGLTFANIGRNGAALLPYLILGGMIWAGLRFGVRAVAAAGFLVALGANIATTLGEGPFSASQRSADIVTLQIFLVIALIASLVVASMASELADRDEVTRLLEHQANHDGLTGLPNKAHFAKSLETALAADRKQPNSGIGVLVINLDDFKRFNDRHGRSVGDGAICAAAEVLRCNLRVGDTVARLGGDTFVVLCTGLAGSNALKAIGADLSRSFSAGVTVHAGRYAMSTRIGAALAEGDHQITAANLLHRADIALHHCSSAPGLTLSVFDDALEADTRRRIEIAEELQHSIERGEMSVLYQPIISIATGRVTEFEALSRWNNRRFGLVFPDEFIPVAEEDGFIAVLGDWVLSAACDQLTEWRMNSTNEGLRVAVNVSASQLADVGFPGRVRSILAETDCPANMLTLELTETAVMYDTDVSDVVLRELRELGVRLSMDDFGTGYSSMSNLRRSPLDVLKVDRSFVTGVGLVDKDTAIVASIIALGHSLGLEVVAEGIETREQLEHLARLGCDYGQGFYWSPAVKAVVAGSMRSRNLDAQAVQSLNGDGPREATRVSSLTTESLSGSAVPQVASMY